MFCEFQHYHYGLVTVSDGKSRPQTARIKLCSESLVLQREEFIFPDDDDGGYPVDNKVTHKLLLIAFPISMTREIVGHITKGLEVRLTTLYATTLC